MPSFRQSIYEIFVLSELVGRWEMQRYVKRFDNIPLNPPTNRRIFDPSKGDLIKKFAESDFIEFPDVFKLALEYFVNKGIITKPQFKKLSAKMRWKSFTVARVSDKKLLESIKEQVNKSTFDGDKVSEFVDKIFDTVGISTLYPYHLETVYVTNALTNYGEGRKKVIDSLSDDEFPYRQVVDVGDDRERAEHRKLSGYTADKNDPVWTWLKTPFSYNCRCGIWPVHKSEGLKASGYVPDVRGKKGFEFL